MTQKAMYVHENEDLHTLVFDINLHSPAMLRQLGFIVLLTETFDGITGSPWRHVREERHPFGSMPVRFAADRFEAASAFCDEHLVENGMPVRALDERIEEADFRHAKTHELSRILETSPHR